MVGEEDRRAAPAQLRQLVPAGASGDSWAVGVAVGLVGAGFFEVVLVSLNQLLELLFGNLFLF